MSDAESGGCCVTAVRKASRRMTQLYDAALAPSGLRSTQYSILREIARRGVEGPTMAELAAALVMDRSSLGHNLRPLERDGLVALHAGVADRRQRTVSLTATGRRRVAAARRDWQRAQDRFEAVVGPQNAAALRSMLLDIAHHEHLGTLR